MEFFNKLEEVIELKLTRLGKKKFRDGNFSPAFYSFADSNSIYDTLYFESGSTPDQNRTVTVTDLQNRMKLSLVPSPSGVDSPFKPEFYKKSIIGSSELGNNKYPAFEIKLYNGHLSGSPSYVTSTFLNQNIPEITLEFNYIFDNTSKTFTQEEYLLMEINELNGLFERENFEIKLYEKYDNLGLGSVLIRNKEVPLKFNNPIRQQETEFDGNIGSLLSAETEEETGLESTMVEYWFDIDYDEKINDIIEFEHKEFQNIYLRPENNISGSNC